MLLAGKRLNGKQKQQFREALDAAFDYDSLEQMLNDNFDKKVTDFIMPIHVKFSTILDEVLKTAERESWTAQLLQAVLSMRPEDIQLITFARQFGSLLITPPLKELVAYRGFERAVTSAMMHDYDQFLQGLWERGSQVCRIEVDGKHMGTGFLVGPDMIMTCYHVWEMVQYPDKCICWFDHGSTSAKPYYLAQNCKIDISKHNPEEGMPNGRASTPDELDYALLQLKDTPGNEPVLRLFQDKPSQRGWITPHVQEYTFPPGSPLYILHYPQLSSSEGSQKPLPVTLKLSQEEHAIIENDGRRVKYTTNTEGGSSGAPCFNAYWELVAMHHFGDPREPPQYNQGIPFAVIKKRVEQEHNGIFVPFSRQADSGTSKTNGHEASENPQQAVDVEKNSLEPQTETSKPGKVVPIEKLREQREAREAGFSLLLLAQARQFLRNAQDLANDAYEPFVSFTSFNENRRPERKKIIDAAGFLKAAEQSIQSLRELLFSDSPMPDELQENLDFINIHIDTIVEEIEERLLPSLSSNEIGDFANLQMALQKINELFPKQNSL